MKKTTIILMVLIFVGSFALCAFVFNLFQDSFADIFETVGNSVPTWYNFESTKTPNDLGTEWKSEDGKLTFSTTEQYTNVSTSNGVISNISPTCGTLLVGEETIPVSLAWDSHSPYVTIYVDDGDIATGIFLETIIEEWYAVSYKETDTEIIFSMKVDKTTYYQVGQIVKLVYKKQ